MKLVVEYEPQQYVFDIDDADYSDFLESGEEVELWFDVLISDTFPEFNARLVNG